MVRPTTAQLRINQRMSEAGFTRAGVGANRLTDIRALDMLTCINANLD
ncbi:MAG: hypothetical protein RIB67_02790 [Miltoncostaeaceae bacterium]